jgi:predicted transcriptional regulator
VADTVNVAVPKPLHKILKKIAKQDERSLKFILREALSQYAERRQTAA